MCVVHFKFNYKKTPLLKSKQTPQKRTKRKLKGKKNHETDEAHQNKTRQKQNKETKFEFNLFSSKYTILASVEHKIISKMVVELNHK